MTYEMTQCLPGDITENYTVDANTDLENYSDKLRVAMPRLRLSPPRDTNQRDMFQYKELDTCSHLFLRRIAIAPPLTVPYDGPHKVVARSGQVMIKGKVEPVTADRVKPAHIERKPENDYTKSHKATPTSKPTASKLPAKTSVPRTAMVGARSTNTPKPSRTGVDRKNNLQARSTIQTQEKIPATDQRSDTTEAQSLKQPLALYRAPHARTAILSRANGKNECQQTYSRIPTKNTHRQSKP